MALASFAIALPLAAEQAAAEAGPTLRIFDFSGNLVRVPTPARPQPQPIPTEAATPLRSSSPPVPTRPHQARAARLGRDTLRFPELPEPEGEAMERTDTQWAYVDLLQAQATCLRVAKQYDVVIEPLEPMKNGPCGDPSPVALKKINGPNGVTFSPPAKLNCEMVAALSDWVRKDLQRVAKKNLGRPIETIRVMSDYACRNAYGRRSGRLSEHARANAIDIGGFVARGDKTVRLLAHWGPTRRDIKAYAEQQERARIQTVSPAEGVQPVVDRRLASQLGGPKGARASDATIAASGSHRLDRDLFRTVDRKRRRFLHAAFETACKRFGTVLGPEANEAHRNHFHFDLATRRRSNYCR